MRRMFWIGAAAVVLALPGGVACGADAPTSPPDPAAAMAHRSPAAQAAGQIVTGHNLLPHPEDFVFAAAAAALTDAQQAEMQHVIAQCDASRRHVETLLAGKMTRAIELRNALPPKDQRDEYRRHLEPLAEELVSVHAFTSSHLNSVAQTMYESAGGFLGDRQAILWGQALRSLARNRRLDPRGLSKEHADLQAGADLGAIPDLQHIASWTIFSPSAPLLSPDLISRITVVLSEHEAEIHEIFEQWNRNHVCIDVRSQLADIRGDTAELVAYTRMLNRGWLDMLERTASVAAIVTETLKVDAHPNLASRWEKATNQRIFPNVYGRTRVEDLHEFLHSSGELSEDQAQSLQWVVDDFTTSRDPILDSVMASLLRAAANGTNKRHMLAIQRRVLDCDTTRRLDDQYRELIDRTVRELIAILTSEQRSKFEQQLIRIVSGVSTTGDPQIW